MTTNIWLVGVATTFDFERSNEQRQLWHTVATLIGTDTYRYRTTPITVHWILLVIQRAGDFIKRIPKIIYIFHIIYPVSMFFL